MTQFDPLDLAVVGNCRIAALSTPAGRINWMCFPTIDGDPVFSGLVSGAAEKGFTEVSLIEPSSFEARYRRNTAILETDLTDQNGSVVRITDFCPRYRRFDRIYHPPMLVRRIEPIRGEPRIVIRVRPTFDHGHAPAAVTVGSNHIRYQGRTAALRLTTDAPLPYVTHESPLVLSRPMTLVFGPDEPVEGALDQTSRELLERTDAYWLNWVRSLGIPLEWQQDVIRAAITLKLCSVDETGAIVAALTTSIPEAPGSTRNWDYRFCWPRDAHFVIKALNALGATQTMESYLGYIANLSRGSDVLLKPVYAIVHDQPLPEWTATELAGFLGDGPVRIGNAAVDQVQHDIYGSIVLAASHMFIDERLPLRGGAELFHALAALGQRAIENAFVPDAGPWELRGSKSVHTYSAAMCWVACDRLAAIARQIRLDDAARQWSDTAERIRTTVLERAWHRGCGAFTRAFGEAELDASALLFAEIGLVSARDPRFVSTVEAIGRELMRGGFVMRYTTPDDFGRPDMAFLACQFWYIDALQRVGRGDEARQLFEAVLARRNRFGLLSEDIDPATGRLWGNIPQTYSMAGIINSAMLLSRRWDDAWARDGTSPNDPALTM